MTNGHLRSLHLYPVKSCRGVDVESATVGPTGLVGDREWQISTAGGAPVTQRQKTVLATVQPEPIEGGLRLSAEGHGSIEVERPATGDREITALIQQPVSVGDAGDEAAAWCAALLDDPDARLYGLAPGGHLSIPPPIDVFGGQAIAFGDLAPVLVTNTASLDWLVSNADDAFAMDRFRANLVVATDEPFAEDTWSRFTIGAAELRLGMPWPRCAIPQVDQVSGVRHKEPARVLAAHRKVTEAPSLPDPVRPIVVGSAVFGIGCAVGPAGAVVAVGDTLDVAETTAPLLAPPD